MSKRHDEPLLRVCFSILQDAEATFPSDRNEFSRDRSRLESLFEDHGSRVFLLDLPALGKHFDKCLSNGVYTSSGLAHGALTSKDVKVPRLFKGLYRRVFDDSGMLRHDVDHNAVFFLRQLFAFGKKLRVDCEDTARYETIADFYKVDRELPVPTYKWNEEPDLDDRASRLSIGDLRSYPNRPQRDDRKTPCCDSTLIDICQRVFDLMSTTLGSFDPYAFMPRHGPGAVADLRKGQFKYDFPSWSHRLEKVFPFSDFGAMPNWGLWNISDAEVPYVDEASKLVCVPKTYKGPRLIAAEPVAHQWCQQIIWDFISTRCRDTWLGRFIHFRDQTHNQAMALLASTDSSKWTIDLSSASDRVSCWLVERAFRRNKPLLEALIASRTGHVRQELDKKSPKDYYLSKFSTMGSACTFPIESLLFLCVCLSGVLYTKGVTKVTTKEVEAHIGRILVFGDDLIVPSDAGAYVEQLLTYLDFKVNDSKTHRTGRFRESCGVEAFDGTDVTPAYYLTLPNAGTPEDVVSSVECSNNFFSRGCWYTADFIKTTVTAAKIAVVSASSGVFGWKTFCREIPRRRRWNKTLQRFESRVLMLRSKVRKTPIERWSALLQYFTERPEPTTLWASGAGQRPTQKLESRWVATSLLDADASTGWFA